MRIVYCFVIAAIACLCDFQRALSDDLSDYLESLSSESDITSIIDKIEYYQKHKINLKTASASAISDIPGIDYLKALKIKNYVRYDSLATFSGVYYSTGINRHQLRLLLLCTEIGEPDLPHSFDISSRTRYFDLNKRTKGFADSAFAGSRGDFYQRLDLQAGNYSANLITSKDAGEKSISDFYSGSLSRSDSKLSIILGDYNADFGAGLILRSGYPASKTTNVGDIAYRQNYGFAPNKSTIESAFFRGMALSTTVAINPITLDIGAGYSTIKRSASISENGEVTSIVTNGLYRTNSEISKKNRVGEQAISAYANFSYDKLAISSAILFIDYTRNIQSGAAGAFLGRSGLLKSINLAYTDYSLGITGEIAADANGNLGMIAGTAYTVSNMTIAVSYRNYSRDFRSPFGGAFAEQSNANNEEGIYLGINAKLTKELSLSAFCDFFASHTRTYSVQMPIKGRDLFADLIYDIGNNMELNLRVRNERKTSAIKIDQSTKQYICQESKTLSRVKLISKVSKVLSLRFGMDVLRADFQSLKPGESGLAGYAEIKLTPNSKLNILLKSCVYSTDSYDSAIWLFEYMMPGVMSIPSLYGDGARHSVSASYKIFDFAVIRIFMNYSIKNNTDTLGSGWDTTTGNSLLKYYLQLDLSY